jgi:hypothetical protein
VAAAVERGLGLVVGLHELHDFGDQLFDAGEAASPERSVRDDPEPGAPPGMASGRLRLQPGGAGAGRVHMEAGPLSQPGPELGVRVGAVGIDD